MIIAVSSGARFRFSKLNQLSIRLVQGQGVAGDAHAGTAVKHRWLARRDPRMLNLRQVHLIQSELFDELRNRGFAVKPGELGENVTTRGIDLLGLSAGTHLLLGRSAIVEVTGLRTPCSQIDKFQKGLLKGVIGEDARGQIRYKVGIMGVVLGGGDVTSGDSICVELPTRPWARLSPV